jgi:hypothetical protein|tara:strand:- start:139 stop:468 length:330 start_codon:yes stop_codon:yes gene_type:complete
MTFKEFQQSARLLCNILLHDVKRMNKVTGDTGLFKEYIITNDDFIKINQTEEMEYLLVYSKDCYIFLELQNHPVADYFKYYLVIGNDEYFSCDLEKLEKILYNEHYKTA